MPNNRYNRAPPRQDHDVNVLQRLPVAFQAAGERWQQFDGRVKCCLPSGCERYYDPIHVDDPGDAVRVICNNEQCMESKWMHGDCFSSWEQGVLAYLRSSGRARSWSEKQRLQNLWTKKGYDLAYRACGCKCQKGHVRKDLDYFAVQTRPLEQDRRGKRGKGRSHTNKTLPALQKFPPSAFVPISSSINNNNRPQLRVRTSSFSSTGSSPPSSAGTPPLTPGSTSSTGTICKTNSFDFFEDAEQAATGNIFQRRNDYSAFKVLPMHQQNPYHIRMEDDGPYGNDEIRIFVLSNLSKARITSVNCVACQQVLTVYDRYPLIDGTFFLSPQRYNSEFMVTHEGRRQYLNAVCMSCSEGNSIACLACRRPWSGSALIIGTMYSYDIFAASPCCAWRVSCKNCRQPVLDPSNSFQFYSEYSRQVECPRCRSRDYHFIKTLHDSFLIKPKHYSIWNSS